MLKALPTAMFAVCLASGVWAQERTPGTLFINVRVSDGTSDGLQDGMSVLVVNNLITAVSAGPIATPRGVTVLDGGGRVLMPGLIDMHTHVMFKYGVTVTRTDFDPESQGAATLETMQLYLRMGYTTLRDVGGNSLGIARNIAAGRIQGHRLYSGSWSGIPRS